MPLDKYDLTTKQRKFCDLYVKTGNGAQAAREAGYSENSDRVIASTLLTKANIKRYVGMKMQEAIEKVGVGKDWRLEMLKKTAEAAFNGQTNKDGVVDAQGVKSMVAEINKMAGDYAPVTSNVNVSETNLEETEEIAEDAEKEINEIKTF